jgi:hypothetical protein
VKFKFRNAPACRTGRDCGLEIMIMNRTQNEDRECEEGMEEARDLLIQGLGKVFKAAFKASQEVVKSFREGYQKNDKEGE